MISSRFSIDLLRYSFGLVLVWIGLLKLFNASVSLEILRTWLPFGLGGSELFLFVFSFLEILIGVGLFLRRTAKISAIVLILLLVLNTIPVMINTGFEPRFPVLSYEGEFVLKNIVLIAGALVLITHKKEPVDNPKEEQL